MWRRVKAAHSPAELTEVVHWLLQLLLAVGQPRRRHHVHLLLLVVVQEHHPCILLSRHL
jgi:hypothetical protein